MLTITKDDAAGIGLNTNDDVFLGQKAKVPDIDIDKPTIGESTLAAFSVHNPIFSNIRYYEGDNSIDEDFDPFDKEQYDLKGFEGDIEEFAKAGTREKANRIKAGILERNEFRKTIDEDGWRGVALSMVSGTLSPENFIPAAVAITSFKTGAQALKVGLSTAATAGVSAAAAEGALHYVQPERTVEESAYAVGGAMLLSGILGGGITGIKTKKFQQIAKVIEADLKRGGMDTSVGAMEAAILKGDKLKVKTAFGYGEIDLFNYLNMGPGARLEINPLDSAKLAGRQLEANPSTIRGNADFDASPQSAEIFIRKWDGDFREIIRTESDLYAKYRGTGEGSSLMRRKLRAATDIVTREDKYLSPYDFSIEVGKAGAMDDIHHIPEVQEAAQAMRKLTNKILEESKKVGKLPKDFEFDSVTAPTWAMRIYSRTKIAARKPEVVKRITEWLQSGGSRQAEIDNLLVRLKDLDVKTQGPMVDKLRTKIEKLENSMDSLASKDLAEIQDAAITYVDRILGNEGVITRNEAIKFGKASPFHARTLLIPDEILDELGILERDSLKMMDKLRRRVVPEIEISRAFGDLDMKETKTKMLEELNRRVDLATTDKERLALQKSFEEAVEDLDAIRDRLLGVYKAPKNGDDIVRRTSFGARLWAYMTHMGGMTVSSIPDIGSVITDVGFKRYVKTLYALTGKQFRLLSNKDKAAIGVGADLWLHSRSNALYEVGDPLGKTTKLERGMKAAGENFSFFAMMDGWNSANKFIAATAIEDRIANAVLDLVSGKIRPVDIEKLASAGINEVTARGIAAQIQKHGTKMRGIHITRFREWDEGTEHLSSKLAAAILRDTDDAIVTKGAADAPLWLSSELGKHIGQFQNFSISANRRLVQKNLQRMGHIKEGDMAVMNGMLVMMAMGYLSYEAHSVLQGRDTSQDTTQTKIREAFDRSGIGAAIWQIPQTVNRATGDVMWESSSRFKARPQLGALMGPTFGMGERMISLPSEIKKDGLSDSVISTGRRFVPYNNMFYMRWLFDNFEERLKE